MSRISSPVSEEAYGEQNNHRKQKIDINIKKKKEKKEKGTSYKSDTEWIERREEELE